MARNKYPEQTIKKILEVATRLFTEKGVEKSSIQDIMNETGLSKGAIYHHFASKEEILLEIIKQNEEATSRFLIEQIQTSSGKNAREKLIDLLDAIANNTLSSTESRFMKLQLQSPVFFMKGMERNMENDAIVIAELIEEGNRDGSLSAEEPEMTAEVLLILFNVWTNPVVFGRDYAATEKRLKYLQKTIKNMGVDVFSDALVEKYMRIYESTGMFGK